MLRCKPLRQAADWKIFFPVRLAARLARDAYDFVYNQVKKSIRLELIVIFSICLLAAILVSGMSSLLSTKINGTAVLDYASGIQRIGQIARLIADRINSENVQMPSPEENSNNENLESFIEEQAATNRLKILIVDLDGKVIKKSKNATENEVDIYAVINQAMSIQTTLDDGYVLNSPQNASVTSQEYVSFLPVTYHTAKGYLIVSGVPMAQIRHVYNDNWLLVFINFFLTFIVLFFLMTRGRILYIKELANGLLEISKGNFSYRVQHKGEDELGSLADNINYMTEQLEWTIEEERRAERTKTELITNVSHDIRTPLTSITGYLRALKDKKYETEQQLHNYIDISYGKAEKLNALIEDLFEYTKLGSDSTQLNYEIVSLNELLQQLMDELVPVVEAHDLGFTQDFPNQTVFVNIDVDKMVRVFDNLLINAIKYSYKPGKIHVAMRIDGDQVTVSITNHGENISQEDLCKIFERFYRVEKSRSSETGGSGLGLAIAKGIVSLHKGQIRAHCENERITFSVQFPTEVRG